MPSLLRSTGRAHNIVNERYGVVALWRQSGGVLFVARRKLRNSKKWYVCLPHNNKILAQPPNEPQNASKVQVHLRKSFLI